MENVVNNKNNKAAAKMQAAATGEKKKSARSKKKKSTRPKLRPVATLPAVNEDNLDNSGLGYDDILVVPPPTPRDKLVSDLNRLEKELKSFPKFSDEWFQAKEELGLVKLKLDDWDNNTPTAARMTAPIVTTNAAYQDIVKSITDKEEEESQQQSSARQPIKKKKKKSSSRKNRPKLKPQSVEKKEEGDEEDGLGFNDILLTTNQSKSSVADERTTLLMDVGGSVAVAPQTQDVEQSNVVGDWLLRGVIGTLFCFLVFKFLMP
ncbi:hypothetical protein ACHAWT_000340 [Skeletonema menzelii]